MDDIAKILSRVLDGDFLSNEELREVFEVMLSGKMNEVQIAGFLSAWRVRGEDENLLAVGSSFLRDHAKAPEIPTNLRPLSDNCGTGGSHIAKFNISTTAALVAASLGVRVAKHGNRSASGRCGSADLLFAAGYPESLNPEQTVKVLEKIGFGFFFAPNFHPVMKYVMPTRQALGTRTIFNLLGPLANPVRPEIQLLGVNSKRYLEPMAKALLNLGVKRALVLHSGSGLDELTPSSSASCIDISGQTLKTVEFDPGKVAAFSSSTNDLIGGDTQTNLKIFNNLLGGEPSPVAEAVCLNAGALLWLNDMRPSIAAGFRDAMGALSSLHVQKYFKNLISVAKS